MKRTNGITLISLIITIIVLLILAGVVLATLTGQGSIIKNAENAVGKYNESVVKEEAILNSIDKYPPQQSNDCVYISWIRFHYIAWFYDCKYLKWKIVKVFY